MRGSLALHAGVLWVGTETEHARVQSYDLDGAPLEAAFEVLGEDGGPASAEGLAVDADHRVWVADGVGKRLVGYSLVGAPLARVEAARTGTRDARGVLARCVDVATRGVEDEQVLYVASGGTRRHALQALPLGPGRYTESLRPAGEQDGRFHDLRGLALGDAGREVWACEAGRARLQVFRDHDFHRAVAPVLGAARFEPNAVAVCADGRLVVAQGGAASALLLLAPGGRLLRVLAEGGGEPGRVLDPGDVVVQPGAADRDTRVVVIDRDGLRVQVFNLEGRCWGAFVGEAFLSDATDLA
ncbi:MAG: hypothetical protein H6828_14245 [Planctomycetes bacterium]|nr:hypothetical protein [Planctomycetota bacterium]